MVDFLRSNDILGRSARERLQEIRQAIESFRSLHARKPTVKELSRQTGLEEDEIVHCLTHEKLESMASLEAPAAEGDSQGCLAELIPAQTSTPLSKLEWTEQVELLAAAIEALPEREKRIIVLYYYEDLYMAEMAEIMGISESRVSQLHTRALYNLTRIMGEDDGR
jgi:RNA polymerase sigma factor for flagellar operon FliA